MKILLIYLCNYEDRHDHYIALMPVGLVSLAASLEKDHEVILANFSQMGYRRALSKIGELKPELVGISLYTHNRTDSLRLATEIKKKLPGTVIVAGGPHATFLAEAIIEQGSIDHVVPGESERAVAQLVRELERGKRPQPLVPSQEEVDIDSLPAPSRFGGMLIDVDPNEQFKYLITSRGCPADCTFCCSPAFWKRRVRFRSAENIVDEMEYLHRRYGIIYFSIRDDNFTMKKKRVIDFCRLIRKRELFVMWNCQSRVDAVDEEMLIAMKRAGLEHIQYGVESGSERILKRYRKGITIGMIENAARITRRAGVYLSVYLMVGMEGETRSDIRKTKSLIRRILPGDGIVSPVALYPGTELYRTVRERGVISDAVWFQKSDAGIFLRDADEMRDWMMELLQCISLIRNKSWYRDRDFRKHRQVVGGECWVTDILEGDYYLDEERYDDAARCYGRVMSRFPRNPWGFFRMGKLHFMKGYFPEAEEFYARLVKLVPAYFGGWLKLAESQHVQGKKKEARLSIDEAYRRNRFDFRIQNLRRLLR
jgi:anaerobic magnesium-protoporphyrin IX monomethyl ester cyclase